MYCITPLARVETMVKLKSSYSIAFSVTFSIAFSIAFSVASRPPVLSSLPCDCRTL